jgi:glutamyl-tRNA reductase
MLERGGNPEEALAFLARTLTRRLIHDPTVGLRRAGREERTEVIDAARELLGLDGDSS